MSRQQSPAQKSERRRGVLLTQQGLHKLRQAKIELEMEPSLKRYTLETLSEQTGLTPTTLSKIFTGSAPVDKRTVANCFAAFDLTLSQEDYLYAKADQDYLPIINLTAMNPAECQPSLEIIHHHQDTLLSRQKSLTQLLHMLTLPGGQIPLNSINYIDRPNIESLCYEAIQEVGIWINITAPKQMGKTSLMTRILAYGKSHGYLATSINLQSLDESLLRNHNSFWSYLLVSLKNQLGLSLDNYHDDWHPYLGTKGNISHLLETQVLAKIEHPLILVIDELNYLFTTPDLAREFLQLLRAWSEQSKCHPIWQKLRLVTLYSTDILIPLTIDPSLFNVALMIKLPGFNQSQVKALSDRYDLNLSNPEIERLMVLLGGHPYRLQLAFYALHQGTLTLEDLLTPTESTFGLYEDHLRQQWWYLHRYPALHQAFMQVLKTNQLDSLEILSALQSLGLVQLQANQVNCSWELFRYYITRFENN